MGFRGSERGQIENNVCKCCEKPIRLLGLLYLPSGVIFLNEEACHRFTNHLLKRQRDRLFIIVNYVCLCNKFLGRGFIAFIKFLKGFGSQKRLRTTALN